MMHFADGGLVLTESVVALVTVKNGAKVATG
jgi:hypothetical protein